MGAYSKLLKQAYEITREYKFLWIFGLFLSLIDIISFKLGSFQEKANIETSLSAGLVVIILLLAVVGYRIITAMIIAIKAILDKQQTSLKKSYLVARVFYWRVLGIGLLMEVALLVVMGLVLWPVGYLHNLGQIMKATSLAITGGIIILPIVVAVLLIRIIAPLFVVIYDQKINEAIDKSYALIAKSWYAVISIGIIAFLLQIATLFLGFSVLKLTPGTGLFAQIFAGIVYTITSTLVRVFLQTVWVLLFLDLIKPQKLEQVTPVVAPELIS